MSSSHESPHDHPHREVWLDAWWPLLVILYGILFLTLLVSFHPYW